MIASTKRLSTFDLSPRRGGTQGRWTNGSGIPIPIEPTNMELRIADTFNDSLARLTGEEQKAVKTTAFDLQLNPAHPSLQFHKLERAKDPNFWSIRVSKDVRIIVHRTGTTTIRTDGPNGGSWRLTQKLERPNSSRFESESRKSKSRNTWKPSWRRNHHCSRRSLIANFWGTACLRNGCRTCVVQPRKPC